MLNRVKQLLNASLIPVVLLLLPACALLNPRPATPEITAGRNAQNPNGITPRLRESFGPREVAAPPSASTAANSVTTPEPASATGNAPYKIRPGDTVIIQLRDLPDPRKPEMQIEDVVDDSGSVNLPLIKRIVFAGKTTSTVEQEIERRYIDDKFYKNITVNVVIPQRLIYVTGEVKLSNKYPLSPGLTLSQAIATAGGVTDFVDRKKIKLIRNGKTTLHDLIEIQKDPSKDIVLEAGDQIDVPRSAW